MALENILTHTQSLRSLTLTGEDSAVAAALSGLRKNTSLRELTLDFPWGATPEVDSLLTSLRDHPLLRRLCLRGPGVNLTGLETLLLSDTSKITELEIHKAYEGPTITIRGLTHVLQTLGRRSTLSKLGLHGFPFE
jgi:hypothetical protein